MNGEATPADSVKLILVYHLLMCVLGSFIIENFIENFVNVSFVLLSLPYNIPPGAKFIFICGAG